MAQRRNTLLAPQTLVFLHALDAKRRPTPRRRRQYTYYRSNAIRGTASSYRVTFVIFRVGRARKTPVVMGFTSDIWMPRRASIVYAMMLKVIDRISCLDAREIITKMNSLGHGVVTGRIILCAVLHFTYARCAICARSRAIARYIECLNNLYVCIYILLSRSAIYILYMMCLHRISACNL